jgi:hypothetical protein
VNCYSSLLVSFVTVVQHQGGVVSADPALTENAIHAAICPGQLIDNNQNERRLSNRYQLARRFLLRAWSPAEPAHFLYRLKARKRGATFMTLSGWMESLLTMD